MIPINEIYFGDCYDYFKLLKDKEIDIIITDPPWGINVLKGGNKPFKSIGGNKPFKSIDGNNIIEANKYLPMQNDNIKIDLIELFRISKNQIIFGGNCFNNLPLSRGWIVWDKKKKDDWFDNFSDGELIWTSFDQPLRIKRHLYMGCMQEGKREKRIHPTQKPIELMRWIIKHYTNENDLIFDPFVGSGSTILACLEEKRNYIGIELDENYYNITLNRIKQWKETHA